MLPDVRGVIEVASTAAARFPDFLCRLPFVDFSKSSPGPEPFARAIKPSARTVHCDARRAQLAQPLHPPHNSSPRYMQE
jgi:hypothetical protein